MVTPEPLRPEETTHGTQRRQRNRQGELFRRSTRPVIALDENHRLVLMTHEIDWTELERIWSVDSPEQAERRGSATASRALIGAQRHGGADSALRAGAILVRPDGDGVDAGCQHDSELRRAARGGRHPSDQRASGEMGSSEGEARGSASGGGRHDGAGGSHPARERDGNVGEVRHGGGGSEQEGEAF